MPVDVMAATSTDPNGSLDPIRRNRVWRTIQFFVRWVFALFLRFRARGIENVPAEGGALLVANHQSFLDPLIVGVALRRPVSYVARDSLFRIPLVGWVVRNTYVIPINREAASADSIREAVRRMHQGFLLGVFPEGTRSRDGRIGEIKPGFIALARRGKLPIVPIGISGAYRAMPRGNTRLYFRNVRIVYGTPIPAEQVRELARKGNEAEFIAFIRAKLQVCLDEADAWRLDQSAASPLSESSEPGTLRPDSHPASTHDAP
jgi:1-acyl-sn-glycerol-3-phosphate acyltransferase